MPTETIEICSTCGKKTCDGGIWKKVSIIHKDDNKEYINTCHSDNLYNCTLGHGVTRRKFLKDKKVGDKVVLEFDNWVHKSMVTVEKVEM